jgi:hypothetical protein
VSAMTPQRRKALAKALRELEALRKEWKGTVDQHQLRVEAQFRELARRLKAKDAGIQQKGLPATKDAERIHAVLARVKVKPAKGRAKDLRHVEDAVAAAIDRLPPE